MTLGWHTEDAKKMSAKLKEFTVLLGTLEGNSFNLEFFATIRHPDNPLAHLRSLFAPIKLGSPVFSLAGERKCRPT